MSQTKTRNKESKLNNQEGYTLIEVMATVFIMGIIMLMVNVVLVAVIRNAYDTDARMEIRQGVEFSIEVIRRYTKSSDPSAVIGKKRDENPPDLEHPWVDCDVDCSAFEIELAESSKKVIFYLEEGDPDSNKKGSIKARWSDGTVVSLTSEYEVDVTDFNVSITSTPDSDASRIFITIVADSAKRRTGDKAVVENFYKQATIITRGETLY